MDSYLICGKVRGEADFHAWNIVRLDGECFHVDVTWDAPVGGDKRDAYFGKSDAELSAERIWSRLPGTACTSERDVLGDVRRQLREHRTAYVAQGADKTYFD